MPKRIRPHPKDERLRETLRNEHAALTDRIKEYEDHLASEGDDPWIRGQLGYWRKRIAWLDKQLSKAENR